MTDSFYYIFYKKGVVNVVFDMQMQIMRLHFYCLNFKK